MKLVITLLLLVISIALVHTVQAADFNAVGDVGCKSAAISNLKNLANKPISFFGLGDYSYKCKSSVIKPLWDQINSKKAVQGNHECEKSGQDSLNAGTYFGNGGCKKGYFAYIRGGDTAVIGLNPYASYKQGSAQYNFVISKTSLYEADDRINWIVYLIHPLFFPVGCSGDHCHGVDEKSFNTIYEPIIKSAGKGFILQGHTHLTAMGTINNIPTAVCGGGGEDGTKLGSSNGYTYGTSQAGYCNFHFDSNGATLRLIGTNNQIIHEHNWNK